MERLSIEERKALVYTAFAGAIVTFLPGEWEAGIALLVIAYGLYRVNRDVFKKRSPTLLADGHGPHASGSPQPPKETDQGTSTVPTDPGEATSR